MQSPRQLNVVPDWLLQLFDMGRAFERRGGVLDVLRPPHGGFTWFAERLIYQELFTNPTDTNALDQVHEPPQTIDGNASDDNSWEDDGGLDLSSGDEEQQV